MISVTQFIIFFPIKSSMKSARAANPQSLKSSIDKIRRVARRCCERDESNFDPAESTMSKSPSGASRSLLQAGT